MVLVVAGGGGGGGEGGGGPWRWRWWGWCWWGWRRRWCVFVNYTRKALDEAVPDNLPLPALDSTPLIMSTASQSF